MRRSLITSLVVLACLTVFAFSAVGEEAKQPAGKSAQHESSSSASASKEEVQQLRSAVASQNQTIQELKAVVQQLEQRLEASDAGVVPAAAGQGARLRSLSYDPLSPLREANPQPVDAALSGQAAKNSMVPQKPAEKPPSTAFKFSVAGTDIQIYGHADVSYDYLDNGISSALEATNPLAPATFPASLLVARANNGWLGQMSSNLSYFGIRGSHKITPYLTGIFQFETEVMFTATPGPTSDLQCKYCLGSRDTYVGVEGAWGKIKLGKEDAPYKRTTTGAFDPFLNTIGDQRSIMGNSGGDNRAEFMGRVVNSIWYESPTYKGLYASVLWSPGQNRASDNGVYARGEPNCTGGNGAFTLSFQNSANVAEGADFNSLVSPPDINPCNDGSWGNLVSTAVTYRSHGLYTFAGYEHHGHVNRTTDLVGIADEAAWKLGAEYTIKATGTTPSFVFERLKRYAATSVSAAVGQPVVDPRLDERSRPDTWLALRQKLSKKDTFNVDWIHAFHTPGDPGNCAPEALGNCAPGQPFTPVDAINNKTNMYAAGLKHTISRNMSTYFVYARQANHADAHYDLGAVGHGVTVDKRDFTGHGFPGTRLQGISGGMTFDF